MAQRKTETCGEANYNAPVAIPSERIVGIKTIICLGPILTDEKFSVSFEYAGQTVDIVDIKANDGKSISNELIYGEVHGMKKDENGKALGGATIGLFYTDGKEPVLTTVSAEDGSFFFKDIPFGEYIVREIEAPEGFVIPMMIF